ncbi:Lysine N-methyltransferase N6AMT2 [Daphnia magna]|uniref:Protein-lysine N-methyltransferase APZ42_019783 n=1 Tax=Daphnia magna TaxID=35525 RepID=A0A0P5T5A5_9CRUS|nr:Lysine N-methyltransferase N6AMT2 [Daphnia magna]CAG4639387.1 EOG090X0ABW [Daphnia magna]
MSEEQVVNMMFSDEKDGDEPELSLSTLAALNEFLSEKKEREERLRLIAETAERNDKVLDEVVLEEDWQLSQFWYDDHTSVVLANEALRLAGTEGRIACISCPTLYKELRKLKPASVKAQLFEYDTRFSVYGDDFTFYDYRSPLEIPKDLGSSFEVVVADPPFLSEECLTKTALTMRYLSKGPLILCTGSIMEDLAGRLLQLRMCAFQPKHRNNLANDFRCYANYDFDSSTLVHEKS